MWKAITAAVLLLALCQCQPVARGSPATTFRIDLSVTPDVLKTMRQAGDKVTVDVYYYGLATPQHKADADPLGRIRLGEDLFDVKPADQSLTVTGAGIDRSLLGQVVGREPHVMIWAYSTDTVGGETRHIDCHYYFGTIAEAQAHRAKVACERGTA